MGGLGRVQRGRAPLARPSSRASRKPTANCATPSATCSATCRDFDPAADAVPGAELPEIDQWILLRAEELVARCRAWYENFAFHKVYHAVYAFATMDLSAVYFDVLKDRLYTVGRQIATPGAARRRRCTASLDALVRLVAPLMGFTAEEVWGHMRPQPRAASTWPISRSPAN